MSKPILSSGEEKKRVLQRKAADKANKKRGAYGTRSSVMDGLAMGLSGDIHDPRSISEMLKTEQNTIQRDPEKEGNKLPTNTGPLNGNVYNPKGELLGAVGEASDEPIVVYDKALLKTIKIGKKQAKKSKTEYKLDATGWTHDQFFIVPPKTHRDEMQRILTADEGDGHQEFGGRGMIPVDEEGNLDHAKKTHVRSSDGAEAGPDDPAATIRVDEVHDDDKAKHRKMVDEGGYAVDYTWHSHPGGSWKRTYDDQGKLTDWEKAEDFDRKKLMESGNTMGGPDVITHSYDLGPSVADINNARSRYERYRDNPLHESGEVYPMNRNFVIHKKEGWVFFYNQDTEPVKGGHNAKIKLSVFWSLE